MQKPNALLDVTRTLARQYDSTPTGIDRVEHALIRYLLTAGESRFHSRWFVITTPYGHALLGCEAMSRVLDGMEARWASEERSSEHGGVYEELRLHLSTRDAAPSTPRPLGTRRFAAPALPRGQRRAYLDMVRLGIAGGADFRRVRREAVGGRATAFVHSSHALLERPRLFDWLDAAGMRSVFFLHDIIPIDYPEYCNPGEFAEHVARMKTIAKHADRIVCNSEYTAERVRAHLADERLSTAPVSVCRLANGIQEYRSFELKPPAGGPPYFVCLGTIEPRKNLLFLLNVWRRLSAARRPEDMPRLVIVGRRGWECEMVVDVLDRTRELSGHVSEVSGLRDVDLASLLAGATALLAPSLEEGYGLPPVEAIRRGTPVVASDIPAHREILGHRALLVDPTDGPGWHDAIARLCDDPEFRASRVAQTRGIDPVGWNDFAEKIFDTALEATVSGRRT